MSTSLLIASRRWLLPSISKTKFQTILNYNVNTQVLICLQTSTTNFQFPFHASKMKMREGKFLTISNLLFNKKTKSTFSFKTLYHLLCLIPWKIKSINYKWRNKDMNKHWWIMWPTPRKVKYMINCKWRNKERKSHWRVKWLISRKAYVPNTSCQYWM